MTIKELDGLGVLLRHAERDMLYGEGGSYVNEEGNGTDDDELKRARLGLKFIQRLVMKKSHAMSAKRISKALASGKIEIDLPTGPAADRKVIDGKITYKSLVQCDCNGYQTGKHDIGCATR